MGEEEAGGSLPICTGCKQRIYDEQYLQALSSDWHTVCFSCSPSAVQCSTILLQIKLFLLHVAALTVIPTDYRGAALFKDELSQSLHLLPCQLYDTFLSLSISVNSARRQQLQDTMRIHNSSVFNSLLS
ncbi:hypothetical protein NQZ68_012219 [Dissostichus eleginoides]|nr:hypothetical protein NQZ68_012219 [Dissostichus eleginoides]